MTRAAVFSPPGPRQRSPRPTSRRGFPWISRRLRPRALIVSASLAEHVLGGVATVAVFTLMMDASDPDHAGSDYTLFASAVVVVQGLAGFAAGAVGDLAGYPALFGTGFVLSGLGCAALVLAVDRGPDRTESARCGTPARPRPRRRQPPRPRPAP